MVPKGGIEPPWRVTPRDFESRASASSATSAPRVGSYVIHDGGAAGGVGFRPNASGPSPALNYTSRLSLGASGGTACFFDPREVHSPRNAFYLFSRESERRYRSSDAFSRARSPSGTRGNPRPHATFRASVPGVALGPYRQGPSPSSRSTI